MVKRTAEAAGLDRGVDAELVTGDDLVGIGDAVPLDQLALGDMEAIGDLGDGVAADDGVRDPTGLTGATGGLGHFIFVQLNSFEFLVHDDSPLIEMSMG